MPLILAFGYEARSGKGECANHLLNRLQATTQHNVLLTSFGKALRYEIHDAMSLAMQKFRMSPHEALQFLCEKAGVQYDPFAPKDELNPWGKQRKLQQFWGTEYRRKQCPSYWVDKVVDEIQRKQPEIVLLDDLRFPNEFEWVTSHGQQGNLFSQGHTVHVLRPDLKDKTATGHISESALTGFPFRHTILNDSSLETLHSRAEKVYQTILNSK